jgi:radical SAM superfamily enzyme YgiQ (UPF0313 family)
VARVFLINPPSLEPVRSPLLSFCYLGSALRRSGHAVAVLDGSAPYAPHDPEEIAERVAAFAPDLVGLRLLTLHVQPGYAMAAALRERLPGTPLVAGGPHPTVVPGESFRFGFSFELRGEGDETLPELADALDGRRDFLSVAGLAIRGRDGDVLEGAPRRFVTQLDALPDPLDATDLFDPAHYGWSRPAPPFGLLSSRGCPAACNFCSNNVTGRRFRFRDAEAVAREAARLNAEFGIPGFTFFDDSWAVGRRRVREIARAFQRHAPEVVWSCTAHPAHLDRDILASMREAGCRGVDIGMESGDAEMLVRIGKGVTRERVLEVLGWCREEGVHSVLNLMFGWPDESEAQLRATLDFMDEAAPLAGAFNARGVLVPYPGTAIYEENHARFGFTEWWLREPPICYDPFPTAWDEEEVTRAYATDAALERNFFGHPPEVLELVREGMRRKAAHTFRKSGEHHPVAAAGAR